MRPLISAFALRKRWLGLFGIALLLAGPVCLAQSGKPEPQPQAASAAVRTLLSQISEAVDKKDWEHLIPLVERGVTQARTAKDKVGIALMLEFQAVLTEKSKQPELALTRWQECAEAWREAKDSPGTAQAFGRVSLYFYAHKNSAEGKKNLLDALGAAENTRPLALSMKWCDLGDLFYNQGLFSEAQRLFEAALRLQRKMPSNSLTRALMIRSLDSMGRVAKSRSEFKGAEKNFLDALSIAQQDDSHLILVVSILNQLGALATLKDDTNAAEQYHQKARAILQKTDPDSLDMAATLGFLGVIAGDKRQDSGKAEEYFTQAVKIRRKHDPESAETGRLLCALSVAIYRSKGDLPKSETLLLESLAMLKKLEPESVTMAKVLGYCGDLSDEMKKKEAARQYYEQAFAIYSSSDANLAETASVLTKLGGLAQEKGEYHAAEFCYKTALEDYKRLAPSSPAVFRLLMSSGMVATLETKNIQAEQFFQEALVIERKRNPFSMDAAFALSCLADVEKSRDILTLAEDHYKESLKIHIKNKSISPATASLLDSIGEIVESRGDLNAAKDFYQRALTIKEKFVPDTQAVVSSLMNLGNIASSQNDFVSEKIYYTKALMIARKITLDPIIEIFLLSILGTTARMNNDLDLSDSYYKEVLAIQSRQNPKGWEAALTLCTLGQISDAQGKLTEAENYYHQALALDASNEMRAGGEFTRSQALTGLGRVAEKRNDIETAEKFYHEAVAIHRKIWPDSLNLADSLQSLAQFYLENKEFQKALPLLEEVTAIVQSQRSVIRDPETRSLFLEKHTDAFTLLVRAYLLLHQTDKALETLERARARTLVEQRAERFLMDKNAPADAPSALLAQRNQLEKQHSDVLKQRQNIDDKKDAARWKQNTDQLDQLAAQQRQLVTEMRRQSPRYASLVYPSPPSLAVIQKGLEEGTLALVYALDEKECYLFAVSHTSLKVYTLRIKGSDLTALTEKFRTLLADDHTENRVLQPLARQLYQTLIAPAQKEVDAAKRLLVCPDGALYQVPFPALLRPKSAANPTEHFLIEDKPLALTPSLGVYLQAKQEAEERKQHPLAVAPLPLYAMGDPQTPQKPLAGKPPAADETLALASLEPSEQERFVRLGGKTLAPIPETGALARRLGTLYGPGSLVRTGKQATKQSVLTEAGKAAVIHFGSHGLLDNGDPLASCLALTPDATGANGFLYAYEALGMRLPGSHVILGACETGLGGAKGQSKSEGVIGLTRAFLYAGASNVTVSLWSVKMESTVALLEIAHQGLHRGLGMSEALREAQIRLLRGQGSRDAAQREMWQRPLFWAAFLNYGLFD